MAVSSARMIHPEVPTDTAKKQKWRSLPLSKAILHGNASTEHDSKQNKEYVKMMIM